MKANLDRKKFYEELATEAEEGVQQNNLRSAYRVMQHIRSTPMCCSTVPVLKADGTICSSEEEILS